MKKPSKISITSVSTYTISVDKIAFNISINASWLYGYIWRNQEYFGGSFEKSLLRIAEETPLSLSSIKRILSELRKYKLIQTSKKAIEGGGGKMITSFSITESCLKELNKLKSPFEDMVQFEPMVQNEPLTGSKRTEGMVQNEPYNNTKYNTLNNKDNTLFSGEQLPKPEAAPLKEKIPVKELKKVYTDFYQKEMKRRKGKEVLLPPFTVSQTHAFRHLCTKIDKTFIQSLKKLLKKKTDLKEIHRIQKEIDQVQTAKSRIENFRRFLDIYTTLYNRKDCSFARNLDISLMNHNFAKAFEAFQIYKDENNQIKNEKTKFNHFAKFAK